MKPFPVTLLRTTSRRPQYLTVSVAVAIITVGFGLLGSLLFAWALATALHLPMDKPMREQSHGWLWFFLFMASIPLSMVPSYLGSFLLLAGMLRWVYGWTPARIRKLMFESEIPPHWLDAPPA